MRTPITRRQHSRDGLRCETDLTNAEWPLIEGFFAAPAPCGRPRAWPLREIVNAIFYVMRGGIAWRLLPSDFPPWRTVYRWFATWRNEGLFERINHALVMADRERAGRAPSPSAAIIDSQSVKSTESGGPHGYDAGKKIKVASDTPSSTRTDALSCLSRIRKHPGSRWRVPVLRVSRCFFPFIERVFADTAYAGEQVANATRIAVEIVNKLADRVGFIILPRRWVVERFFAWINRNRRLAKDLRRQSPRRPLSSMPPPSCCSPDASPANHEFRDGL